MLKLTKFDCVSKRNSRQLYQNILLTIPILMFKDLIPWLFYDHQFFSHWTYQKCHIQEQGLYLDGWKQIATISNLCCITENTEGEVEARSKMDYSYCNAKTWTIMTTNKYLLNRHLEQVREKIGAAREGGHAF